MIPYPSGVVVWAHGKLSKAHARRITSLGVSVIVIVPSFFAALGFLRSGRFVVELG